MKQWSEEHCAQRPDELQAIAPGLFMQRRGIREVTHEADETAGTEAYTEFVLRAGKSPKASMPCWKASRRSTPTRRLTRIRCS